MMEVAKSGGDEHDVPVKINQERLAQLQRMAANVRTGGRGSVRRKKKSVHKAAPTDDKRLQVTIKRLGLNVIPAIEEVNLFSEDRTVINFVNPKVQASIGANTYVVSGPSTVKSVDEMIPEMFSGLGQGANSAEMAQLQALMQQVQTGAAQEAQGGDGDDDVPDLVGDATFEDAGANSTAAKAEDDKVEEGDAQEQSTDAA